MCRIVFTMIVLNIILWDLVVFLFYEYKGNAFFSNSKASSVDSAYFSLFFFFFFSETAFSGGDRKNYVNERKKYFEFLV